MRYVTLGAGRSFFHGRDHFGSDVGTCTGCGRVENLDLLDGKDDGTGDFTLLECVACYGPGWLPAVSLDAHASVRPDLERDYARHRQEVELSGVVFG